MRPHRAGGPIVDAPATAPRRSPCPIPTSPTSSPTSTTPTAAWRPCGTAPPRSPTSRAGRRGRRLGHRPGPPAPPGQLDADVDRLGQPPGRGGGDTWYVGRRHVEDARGDPVVVDWRADVAIPFYRATAGRRPRPVPPPPVHDDRPPLDDLFDEVFDDPDSVTPPTTAASPTRCWPSWSGSGRARCDIVATIAAEQDEVIRAPLARAWWCRAVPGPARRGGAAPGRLPALRAPGKLDVEGVLVIGPNPIFLRYIAQVLPSLGETAARQTTLERLLAGTAYRATGVDRDGWRRQGRRPHGGGRRPGGGRVPPPAGGGRGGGDGVGRRHRSGQRTWRRPCTRWPPATCPTTSAAPPSAARRPAWCGPSWSAPRRRGGARGGAGPDLRGDRGWAGRSTGRGRRSPRRRWCASCSPTGRPGGGRGDPGHRRAGGDLLRPPSAAAADEPWTVADLALLDEADAAVAGRRGAYGHIVVDEAQDLSTMGPRALARRSPGPR